MSTSFEMWNIRLTEASDEIARRKLIGELGVWRAKHLSDIPAMRSASFAMSRLYMLVGDHASAVKEAHSLYSLCQTAPVATAEEFKRAKAYLRSLGLVVAQTGGLVEKKKIPAKDPAAETRRLIKAGNLSAAMKLLRGRKGPTASLYRVWIELSRALSSENEAEALASVRKLHDLLGKKLELDGGTERSRRNSEGQGTTTEKGPSREDPLAAFMGMKSLPRKRDPKVRLLERYVREHPERLDELVEVALKAHVAEEGLKRTAPWLSGFVARALVREPDGKTKACVDALLAEGAYAVTGYEESGAKRGISLLGAALERGWDYRGFRRGVLRDGRLEGNKVWTVKLAKGSSEPMVAIVADGFGELELELQGKVFDSIRKISGASLLWLDREQKGPQTLAEEKGLPCCVSGKLSDVLDALAEVRSVQQPKQSRHKPSPLAEALRTPELPSVETLRPLIETYRRTYKSFEACRGLLSDPSMADSQTRVAVFLRAADQVAPEAVKLNEGITVVVQGASLLPEGPIAQLLQEEAVLGRYGGSAVFEVLPVGRVIVEAGWSISRAMIGPTRRERDTHAELGDSVDTLWRLIIEADGERGEIWHTKAAGDQLLKLAPLLVPGRSCLILDGSGSEIGPLAGAEAGPLALGWDGSQGAAVAEVLREWSKIPERTPESKR